MPCAVAARRPARLTEDGRFLRARVSPTASPALLPISSLDISSSIGGADRRSLPLDRVIPRRHEYHGLDDATSSLVLQPTWCHPSPFGFDVPTLSCRRFYARDIRARHLPPASPIQRTPNVMTTTARFGVRRGFKTSICVTRSHGGPLAGSPRRPRRSPAPTSSRVGVVACRAEATQDQMDAARKRWEAQVAEGKIRAVSAAEAGRLVKSGESVLLDVRPPEEVRGFPLTTRPLTTRSLARVCVWIGRHTDPKHRPVCAPFRYEGREG